MTLYVGLMHSWNFWIQPPMRWRRNGSCGKTGRQLNQTIPVDVVPCRGFSRTVLAQRQMHFSSPSQIHA